MQQRSIGDITVSAIGLGAMPLSTKEDRPSPEEAEAVVHAALDAGVTLIDTADAYAWDESEFGHNESLVAAALRSYGGDTSGVLVATKGGHTRRGTDWELDGSAGYLRRACEGSLRRLGVEAIGLYQFHRPDPATPWEESMAAMRSLHDDGLVRMVGISNADIAQIDAAREIVGDALVSVQNQFSPGWRSSAGELAHCAEVGLAWLPWSPFGGVSSAGSLGSAAP
ncbi:MAG: aldo/keto reductase, partial [Blastococcus sp.]